MWAEHFLMTLSLVICRHMTLRPSPEATSAVSDTAPDAFELALPAVKLPPPT